MQNNCSNRDVAYGGFWVRFAAWLADSVIVWSALLFVGLFLSGLMAVAGGTVFGGNILFHYTLKDIVLYGCQAAYFILFTYCTGTTPGKRLFHLRVVPAEGERLGLVPVIYRETVGRFLSGLLLGIGYVMAGIHKEKQALHDMLCDTKVVYSKKIKVYSVPAYPMPAQMQRPGEQPVQQAPPGRGMEGCRRARPEDERQEREL